MIIQSLGSAAAHKIFWWFEWRDNFHFYHIAQNFIGIGIASLILALLIRTYEPEYKWLVLALVVPLAMMLIGNINYPLWDYMGLVRYVQGVFVHGDIGAKGVFLEILLLPFLAIYLLDRLTEEKRRFA
ncbi:hypothetical protein [Shewanella sp. Isolate11]|uniref:hypothetical protein n=1 Tax=Shewanella sp. Isolate11 TaxID=2908530 RepID=UPI001EFEE14A|nr:hypothetical protein [Shewanella sp. Isolate11]